MKEILLIEDDEKRIACILGAKKGNKLPDVSMKTLRLYYSCLSENLLFSFDADYLQETGPFENTRYDIKVTGLLNLDGHSDFEFYGLLCEGKQGRRKIVIPLAEVEVKQQGKNKQLIEDYRMWFWNYR